MPPHPDPRARRVAELLHEAARRERAPEALRARLEAMGERAAAGPPRGRWRPLLPRLAGLALPAAAAGAAVLVLALGGAAGTPSVAQAAALALRAPDAPAPGPDPRHPGRLLSARVGTLHFPDWTAAGGWRPVGERADALGNRTVTTVYYAAGAQRVAYSIVSSPTLPGLDRSLPPAGRPGDPYGSSRWHGNRVTVIWVQSGHTCLLTGSPGLSAARLWALVRQGRHRPTG